MSFFVYTEYAGHLLSVVAVIDIQRCLLEILSDLPAGGIFRVTGEITGIDQRRLMRKRCQYQSIWLETMLLVKRKGIHCPS